MIFATDLDLNRTATNVPRLLARGRIRRISHHIWQFVVVILGAAPSQWDPAIVALSERYCVVTLTGPALGMVASLEARGVSRGHTPGYMSAVGSLTAAA